MLENLGFSPYADCAVRTFPAPYLSTFPRFQPDRAPNRYRQSVYGVQHGTDGVPALLDAEGPLSHPCHQAHDARDQQDIQEVALAAITSAKKVKSKFLENSELVRNL